MKTIYCAQCKTYLGVIRDAKLKKGMVCLCAICESARKLSRQRKDGIADFFEEHVFK